MHSHFSYILTSFMTSLAPCFPFSRFLCVMACFPSYYHPFRRSSTLIGWLPVNWPLKAWLWLTAPLTTRCRASRPSCPCSAPTRGPRWPRAMTTSTPSAWSHHATTRSSKPSRCINSTFFSLKTECKAEEPYPKNYLRSMTLCKFIYHIKNDWTLKIKYAFRRAHPSCDKNDSSLKKSPLQELNCLTF